MHPFVETGESKEVMPMPNITQNGAQFQKDSPSQARNGAHLGININ